VDHCPGWIQPHRLFVRLAGYVRTPLYKHQVPQRFVCLSEIGKKPDCVADPGLGNIEIFQCNIGLGRQAQKIGIPGEFLQASLAGVRRGLRIAGLQAF
jgi:hypothetical protein